MAKHDRREARLRAGVERLKALRLATDDAPIAELERAAAGDPELALAVIARLGDRVSEESVSALRRLDASAADKEVRREARRALYRLAQKGLSVPDSPPSDAAPPRHLFAEDEPEGFLSPQDPFGDRLFWILKPRPGGGLYHLSTVVNEPAGLREAVLAEVSRKGIRTLRSELEARHGLRLVEVDWRYCDSVSSEGYERARTRGTLSNDASSWPQLRLQLFRKPPEPVRAPIEAVLGEGTDEEVAASSELFGDHEFEHWFLPESTLAPYLERYTAIRDSPILLDRPQQIGRIQEIIDDALREIFTGETGVSWTRRLQEASWILWKTGRGDAARRAHAAARALATRGAGNGIPFFEELTRRSFGIFFAREAQKEQEERASSVIVTPDQIREQQARAKSAPVVPRRRR